MVTRRKLAKWVGRQMISRVNATIETMSNTWTTSQLWVLVQGAWLKKLSSFPRRLSSEKTLFTDSPPSNAETFQIPAEKMPRNHREIHQMANLLSIY
jgi:hypothetical protein